MRNVKATSAHTGSHHNVAHAIFEVLNETLSVDLILATVQYNSLMADLVQFFEEIVCLYLSLNKDEYASLGLLKFILPDAKQLQQTPKLVCIIVEDLHGLLYVAACLASIADDNLDRPLQDSLRQVLDGARESRREHDSLLHVVAML